MSKREGERGRETGKESYKRKEQYKNIVVGLLQIDKRNRDIEGQSIKCNRNR